MDWFAAVRLEVVFVFVIANHRICDRRCNHLQIPEHKVGGEDGKTFKKQSFTTSKKPVFLDMYDYTACLYSHQSPSQNNFS